MNPFIKIQDQYYIRQDAAVDAGVKSNTLYQRSKRNKKRYGIIYDPSNKNSLLHQFDLLKEEDQDLIITHYNGTPEQWLSMQPIRNMIIPVPGAEDFYISYRYDLNGNPTRMSSDMIDKCSRNARVMEMLRRAWSDKKTIKKAFGMQLETFIDQVIKIIIADNYDLPHSYPRLMSRPESPFKRYLNESFAGLIPKTLGVRRAAKIENNECESALLEIIRHANQYDDVLACKVYNNWAISNGYKEITPRTVTGFRQDHNPEIMMEREGNGAFNEKYIRQVKGIKPTAPLFNVESDDNSLDYYFYDKETGNTMSRYVSYIIMDVATGLLLGKSYMDAESPTFEMVQLAWIDAMYYIRDLTGGWYLPFEVKADHWQKKIAFPYFQRIAKFVPPMVANKHRGYIEPYFGSPHFKRAQKLAAHNELNYNGNNIIAKTRGVNLEVLNANAKKRPMVGIEADKQVEKFIHLTRTMSAFTRKDMNAPSREQQFKDRWAMLSEEDKRPISDEQFLMIFGMIHNGGKPITITNRGVEFTRNDRLYSYDLADYVQDINLIGQRVQVIYDPYDISRVLVTNGAKISIVVHNAAYSERGLHDSTVNSRTLLNTIISEKKAQVAAMGEKSEKRQRYYMDPKAAIMGEFMPKELKNAAESRYLAHAAGQDFASDGGSDWDDT